MMVLDLFKTGFPRPLGTVPPNPVLDLQDIKSQQQHLEVFVLRCGIRVPQRVKTIGINKQVDLLILLNLKAI